MKYIINAISLVLLFCLFSCKSEVSSNQNNTQSQAEATEATEATDKGMPVPLERMVIKDSPEGDGNWNWTFLTNQMLHYKNTIVVGQDVSSNPLEGHWIDMKTDGTYSTGVKSQKSYDGKWIYNHDTKELTLIPNPAEEKNTQWKVQFNDDMLVWVGTAKYIDNATQIRLVRSEEYPK